MKLPKIIFGISTEEAYKRAMSREDNGEKKKEIITIGSALNLDNDNYIYVPSINLYVAKEKVLHNKDWNNTHKALQKQNQRMLTIPQFVSFINYLRNDYQDRKEAESILDEILTVRSPWRSEWLDAYFEKRNDGLYVLTDNRTNSEKLESYLTEDKTPGIDLDSWLDNPTKQGLPDKNIPKGKLYYWSPVNGRVAGFGAGSDRAVLYCYRDPQDSYSDLGVRPCVAPR